MILYKIKVTIHNPIFQIKKDNFMNTETQNYKIIVAYDGTRYKMCIRDRDTTVPDGQPRFTFISSYP